MLNPQGIASPLADKVVEILDADRKIRLLQFSLCASFSFLWEGLPLAMANVSRFYGVHLVSVMMLAGLALFALQFARGRQRFDIWVAAPIVLFATMIGATVISSTLFFENPILDWVPALSGYSALFLIFLARALDIRLSELIAGVLFSSVVSAIFVVIYYFADLYFMDQFAVYSGFDIRNKRVLFLKNEIAFGIMISFARLAMARSLKQVALYGGLLVLLGFDLIVVSEVRLVIGAVLISLAFFVLFSLPGKRRIVYIAVGFLFLFGAGPFVFGKYIDRIIETQDYAIEDRSVAWRIITVDHYAKYFDQSRGIGFGVMSSSPNNYNILTYSYYSASARYGDQGWWGIYIADASLFGALFQFGYPGLLVAVFMSLYGSVKLLAFGRRFNMPHAKELAGLGFIMFFLVASPWPLNLFTLSWPLMSGSILWCIAARASIIDRKIRHVRNSTTSHYGRRSLRFAT